MMRHFSLMHMLLNWQFQDDQLAKRTGESGVISNIFEQAIHRLSYCNVTFWLTYLTKFIWALLKMLKECIYAQS